MSEKVLAHGCMLMCSGTKSPGGRKLLSNDRKKTESKSSQHQESGNPHERRGDIGWTALSTFLSVCLKFSQSKNKHLRGNDPLKRSSLTPVSSLVFLGISVARDGGLFHFCPGRSGSKLWLYPDQSFVDSLTIPPGFPRSTLVPPLGC